jgi:hypothetical protein
LIASNITSLVKSAKLALDEPGDDSLDEPDIEQDGEELSRTLQDKIRSLERLNTSIECPAKSYFDEYKSDTDVVARMTNSRS